MLHLLVVKWPISSLEGFFLLKVVKELEPMVSAREAHSSESKSGLVLLGIRETTFLRKPLSWTAILLGSGKEHLF